MEKLKIGEVISKLRKEKGITQEQLANFVGVSTPAVSKWESGISYPDITLLPILARFFSVSIDKLLNYNNSLSKEEEEAIVRECQSLFNEGQEEVGYDLCMKYIEEYPSSYSLKFSLAVMLNFSCGLTKGEERQKDTLGKTIPIFEDIVENCTDKDIVNGAIMQLGVGYTVLKDFDKALELYKGIQQQICDTTAIIASIYAEQGKVKEARKLLQEKLIVQINEMYGTISSLGCSYFDEDIYISERYIKLVSNFIKVFENEGYPNISMDMNLALAQLYAKNNLEDKCINALKETLNFIDLENIGRPIDYSNVWFLSKIDIPKEEIVTVNFVEMLIASLELKEFALVHNNEEFKNMIKEIKEKL
ncbi:helix-turn-helix domain-containing protein [Clostridium cylindrosporum]|uniref:Putative DNA-binding protein n=1 Tax=Clostridium cylindrosporum DSM 605 TaxID=1121307 RepID=A0A0J8D876_CLOCY|nr:helix-turn-helix transcriptional regulator [Clostridium cylindrosporum]KMT22260.1 putative DNA-binding protein [Clostridium cylindrosporum DSM 605]